MAANVVLRIGISLRLVWTYDTSPTGLEYQADVARHRFGIVCIEPCRTMPGRMLEAVALALSTQEYFVDSRELSQTVACRCLYG